MLAACAPPNGSEEPDARSWRLRVMWAARKTARFMSVAARYWARMC